MEVSTKERIPKPPYRHLRHFAFDPSLSRRIGTCGINEVVANLPWDNDLKIGPMDDYLEVVDYDPASQVFYAPVDLNDPLILAQDGLPPSVGSPQFHQQMVYAVARTTIAHFEKALGRRALWAPHLNLNAPGNKQTEYVGRLRIYPHALREANAYYSPAKKALLFGYFPAEAADQSDNYPGEIVFGCLSHDIIAHETTHALLDGMHARFIEPSNEDVLAFHEAFADIVALFQHFTYPEVLRHQIARTRGDLKSENLLGELAFQFGQAIGNRGALRSAIGDYDKNGNWVPETPDPEKIHTLTEVHARGSILVAAVFDAFNMIYKSRIASVIRVATGGTGILPEGELYPDLVDSLAEEAAKTAGQILQICIRALDYCPPVDINFGDYLRALITADYDLVADDRYNYRLAFIQAFRQRGIYPHDVRNMSVESLVWDRPEHPEVFKEVFTGDFLKDIMGRKTDTGSRKQMFYQAQKNQARFHAKLAKSPLMIAEAKIVQKSKKLTFFRDSPDSDVRFQVFSVRPASRISPDGRLVTEIVVEIIQSRNGYLDPGEQEKADRGDLNKQPDFILRGGCTLLIDPSTGSARYCIYKKMESENRLIAMRQYYAREDDASLQMTYFGDPRHNYYRACIQSASGKKESSYESFAFLHRSYSSGEVAQ